MMEGDKFLFKYRLEFLMVLIQQSTEEKKLWIKYFQVFLKLQIKIKINQIYCG